METLLRGVVPAVLAIAAAVVAERSTAQRGFYPPGFFVPWRRAAALLVLAGIFYLGLFLPLGMIGLETPPLDPEAVGGPRLFLLQGLLLASLVAWFLLGYAGVARRPAAGAGTTGAGPGPGPAADPDALDGPSGGPTAAAADESAAAEWRSAGGESAAAGWTPAEGTATGHEPGTAADATVPAAPPPGRPSLALTFARQFGLVTRRPLFDLGLGVGTGILGWAGVVLLMVLVVVVAAAVGGEESLPQEPPQLVLLIASLPWLTRVGIAATAGVVEELFFRGFLQPRIGILPSTALFALAHLSYDQPFMLIGITALSLFFAYLVRWRRNVWAAIVAHATFDAVQLLIVIPWVLRMMPETGGG